MLKSLKNLSKNKRKISRDCNQRGLSKKNKKLNYKNKEKYNKEMNSKKKL